MSPGAILALMGLGALHVAGCYLVVQQRLGSRWGAGVAMAVALAARLLATQMPISFSDDLFRYRWEGRWQARGGNPYATAPNDAVAKQGEPPDDAERVAGRDFRAVYGPLLLWVERVTYAWAGEAIGWWRAPAALADLAAMAMLSWWIRLRGWPWERVLIYAGSPIPVLEFWSSGHHDAWIVLLVACALVAREKGSSRWTMGALGLAVLTKYWPLMLVPLFAGKEGRSWRWALVIPGLAAAAFWPYWTALESNVRFATGFVGGWRNNDFLFGWILAGTGDIYRAKYTAFALIALGLVLLWWRGRAIEEQAMTAIVVMLAVSANIHPWYGAWLLPFLIAIPRPAVLLWLALFPLFYETVMVQRITGEWQGWRDLRWLAHAPFAVMIAGQAVLRSTVARKTRHN